MGLTGRQTWREGGASLQGSWACSLPPCVTHALHYDSQPAGTSTNRPLGPRVTVRRRPAYGAVFSGLTALAVCTTCALMPCLQMMMTTTRTRMMTVSIRHQR